MDPCCSRVNCRKCWLLKGGKVARFPQDCWEVKRTMRRRFTEWDRVGWLIPFRLYSLCLESLGEDKIHSALQTSLHNLTAWLIPGVLQSTELQRVGHDLATEQLIPLLGTKSLQHPTQIALKKKLLLNGLRDSSFKFPRNSVFQVKWDTPFTVLEGPWSKGRHF